LVPVADETLGQAITGKVSWIGQDTDPGCVISRISDPDPPVQAQQVHKRSVMTAIVMAFTLLAGCGSDPMVDGWPIGPQTNDCGEDPCSRLVDAATAGFDRLHPGHAVIVRASLHEEGRVVDASGAQVLVMRSGIAWVVRFELADGSVRAIGVGYPGVSRVPQAFADGP